METNITAPYTFDSYPQRVIVASILTVVFVLGIFGNGLVILSVLVSHRLRDATNVFVVNLASADFLACLFIPANVIGLLVRDETVLEESVYCALAGAVTFVTIGVSLYTLASLAVIRCLLLTQSIATYGPVFGNKPIIVSWISLLWIVPSVIVSVPVSMNVDHFGYDPMYHSCTDGPSQGKGAERVKDGVLAVGFFIIPAVFLVVSYWKIYKHVMIHSGNLKPKTKNQQNGITMKDLKRLSKEPEVASEASQQPSASLDSLARNSPATPRSGRYRKNPTGRGITRASLSRKQIEITKNLFYVLCAFVVCVLPYMILLVFDDNTLAPFAPYAACCLIANSCINWVIYATKHPYFKVVFRCILSCRWQDIPEPVKLLPSV